MTVRPTLLVPLAAAILVMLPADAAAHGIGDSTAGRTILEFIPLGIEHMLLGWDHLLFIAGVVLLAGSVGRAAKLISLFVAGHSLTLIVATLAGWQVDATLVDAAIALSVAYVGVQGLRGRPTRWAAVGAIVFGFGLVHGLGLSTRLQDLGIPDDDLLWRVLAFNLGVEIGQLWALGVIFGLGLLIRRSFEPNPEHVRLAFALLMATGLIAAAVLSFPSEEQLDGSSAIAAKAGCDESPAEPPSVSAAGGHPAKQFFGPNEAIPEEDLDHVIGDGYVIVRYGADLPASDRAEISRWLTETGGLIVAAPDPELRRGLTATTASTRLACESFDLAVVSDFNERWVAELTEQRLAPTG